MEAFLVSISTVALAEMGDRTQLLSLLLATRFRRPWPILAGVFVATLGNHALAGVIGVWIGHRLSPAILDAAVGVSMVGMALWMLKPDTLNENDRKQTQRGVFLTTLVAFFIAEIGDKTQIATLALAAGYSNLFAVVAGTTCGMLAANAPVVFLGNTFAGRLRMRAIHYTTTVLPLGIGAVFIIRATRHWP
jgi:putative Ca2+/H+ antiporter (TMEM165/GDT1 family)